jgi:hypothetical protein
MLRTESGQISIDFLLGISLFILTLGFLIQFIPSLFLSTSEEGSLNSVAYRTANILTEDSGWWQNNTHNGTDWEEHIGYLSRLGLAFDKTPQTKQTKTPNILNKTKISHIQNQSKINETVLTNTLGLYDNINGAHVDYGYNITLDLSDRIMHPNNSEIFSLGRPPLPSQDVFKITRKVLVETGQAAIFDANELKMNVSDRSVEINISEKQTSDVVIQIKNFTLESQTAGFDNATLNDVLLSTTSEYKAFKRTNTSGFFNYSSPLNSTDTICLAINKTLFLANTTLKLNFTQVNFTNGPQVEYTANVEPLYEPASLVVMVWK